MTHQNHQTNGASLEDCHTNFFALTELYGIKWRKLVWGETTGGGGCGGGGGGEGEEGAAPLADPVISSYARCLAGDILCVWRRVPAPQPPADLYEMSAPAPPPPPPLSLRAAKELWIFWYGEEPDLNGLVAPELMNSQGGDQGSWELGLSYECRSLLFKALHNLIERCLLSRDFVRLGKWFVQPYDGDEEEVGKSPWHLSFSFAFFLHGESTVCASVDVRQHPPVRTLTKRHRRRLAAPPPAHARRLDTKVILAPFGLEGTLTGREWSDADAGTARLLDAWRQLYPLEQGCGALEVICGGVRMRYPGPYVLGTRMEEPPAPPPRAAALAARSLRALTTPAPHQSAELCSDAASDKAEDFVDPTRKTNCTCAKLRRRRGARGPRPPFHRRAVLRPQPPRRAAAHAHPHPPPQAGSGAACSPGSCGGASPAAATSAPPSAGAPPPSPHHTALPSHQSSCVPASLHTPAPTPDPLAPQTPAPPSAQPPKLYNQGDSPPSGGCLGAGAGAGAGGGGGSGGGGAGGLEAAAELLRRPVLPAGERRLDPLEDEHELQMLYDYTTVHAWLEHPVKRFKPEESRFREELALGAACGADLYAGQRHTLAPQRAPHAHIKQEKHEYEDLKEYKNLFTSDGLCPTFKDLDQIFDNSDDAASGDETVRLLQVQTPPDSNKSEESRCAAGGGGVGGGGGGGGRCVRPEELSKMFPTPPSMEAHAQPSPGFSPDDAHAPAALLHHHHHHHQHHHHAGSPPLEPIEDWSYVFKPPPVAKYVGSSKYAALPTLPSQLLPPVALPPHAVYRPRWQRDAKPRAASAVAAAAATATATADAAPTASASNNNAATAQRQGIKRTSSPAVELREARELAGAGGGGGAGSVAASPCGRAVGVGGSVGGVGASACASGVPSPQSPASPRAAAAACPLLVNVLLADTALNVFRDHNFDSCTLCVCNAGPKMVGNIRGADAATYLCWGAGSGAGAGAGSPGGSPRADDEPPRCSCGFSAVVNRRLAHRAGLFYEDELEITGLAEECGGAAGGGGGGGSRRAGGLADVAGVVLAASAAPAGGRADALARAARERARTDHDPTQLNLLEYSDGGAAATRALRVAAGAPCSGAVHRWPFIGARAPRSSRDVVRLMRRLRPLLQDAIQKRCCGARMWDGVSGPLTWRQFHRLAGRGNEDLCEPQPVPPLLVGHDRDWLSLSPYALRHWERLALEPYSYSRDVAYVVLAADCDALQDPLRNFFRELTAAYEACRLGRHRPIDRVAREGLVRAAAAPAPGADADEWAGELPAGRARDYLRAYADTLRATLVPQLGALSVDRSLFEPADRPAPSPMRPPSTPDHPATPGPPADPESEPSAGPGGGGGGGGGVGGAGLGCGSTASWDNEEGGGAALVVYVVEPPASHAHRAQALHALLRLAAHTHRHLQHHNPLIKIISLESVCEWWSGGEGGGEAEGAGAGCGAEARALAFSVFTSARRLLVHTPNGKSLTGFGTAAAGNLFIKNKEEKDREPYKLFSPAWVLAGGGGGGLGRARDAADAWGGAGAGGGGGAGGETAAVLYVAYCLSHDQRWLLAAATDARGELLDTLAVNIHVPARSRRRRCAPARRLGLAKLMDFIVGVMSQSAQPWRLIVGRVGRIGHGELKGWSWLLSRKNLVRVSGALRAACGSCGALAAGAPGVLSACLVSTEPDPAMRLMADRFTPDERFSQASIQSHLHTPRDVTATHILVFPTSATTQSNQSLSVEPMMPNGEGNDMMFLDMDMEMDDDMGEANMSELFSEGELFNGMWLHNSPRASPRRADDEAASREGSPARHHHAHAGYAHADDHNAEQVGTVLQQPLALGYLVSTAPLGGMPAWWWAGSAHLRDACPACLKNALHLHAGNVQANDDFASFTQRRDHNAHPLDSQTTTDVLRYVLEGYNALSWLALDGSTHDRLSCLPLHVQVLMQLYHTAAALG